MNPYYGGNRATGSGVEEQEVTFRENSIQSDLNYLDNRTTALINILQDLELRTIPVRLIETSAENKKDDVPIQAKSPIGEEIQVQISKVQRGINIIEVILSELTI